MARYMVCLIPGEHAPLTHTASPSSTVLRLGLLRVQSVPSQHWCRWIFCSGLVANCHHFQLVENFDWLIHLSHFMQTLQSEAPSLAMSVSPSNLVTPPSRNGGLTHGEGWHRRSNTGTQMFAGLDPKWLSGLPDFQRSPGRQNSQISGHTFLFNACHRRAPGFGEGCQGLPPGKGGGRPKL